MGAGAGVLRAARGQHPPPQRSHRSYHNFDHDCNQSRCPSDACRLIRRDIDRDNLLPPLAVIQILGRYPNVPLSVVRECIYLRLHVLVPLLFFFFFLLFIFLCLHEPPLDKSVCSRRLEQDYASIQEDRRQIKAMKDEKEKMIQELVELRSGYVTSTGPSDAHESSPALYICLYMTARSAKHFVGNKCNACTGPLENDLPTVHFFCMCAAAATATATMIAAAKDWCALSMRICLR